MKDAQIILHVFEEECHKREDMLRSTLDEAEEICRQVHEAEQQVKQADHWVGKAHFIIRKSSFGQALQSSSCKMQPLVLEIWDLYVLDFISHFSIYSQMSTLYIYKEEV